MNKLVTVLCIILSLNLNAQTTYVTNAKYKPDTAWSNNAIKLLQKQMTDLTARVVILEAANNQQLIVNNNLNAKIVKLESQLATQASIDSVQNKAIKDINESSAWLDSTFYVNSGTKVASVNYQPAYDYTDMRIATIPQPPPPDLSDVYKQLGEMKIDIDKLDAEIKKIKSWITSYKE